ncbi:MAG: ABC transporter permease [Planctomycetia bacterium]
MTAVASSAAETATNPPATRAAAWAEHPLALPTNVSWVLWGLVALSTSALTAAPWPMWAAILGWGLLNAAATVRIALAALKPLDAGRRRDEPASSFRDAMFRLRRNQAATLSLSLLVLLILLCFGQGWLFKLGATPAAEPKTTLQQWQAAWQPAVARQLGDPDDPSSFYSLHVDPLRVAKEDYLLPPDGRHWFGTDPLGRDLFARTLYGGRISFLVALVATTVSLVVGISWGAVAGYFGGKVDAVMMRVVDTLYGLPFMFLVILILSLVNGLQVTASQNREAVQAVETLERQGKKDDAAALAGKTNVTVQIRLAVLLSDAVQPIYVMFFALGMVSWLTMARIVRGQVLSLKEREFVLAARVVGASDARIVFRHIVPNLLGPVVVYATLTIPGVMLAEAFLSFLGLGISQPDCSWGSLASEGLAGVNVVKPSWWLLVYPAAAVSLALFCLNFAGDGLRDALDPRARR